MINPYSVILSMLLVHSNFNELELVAKDCTAKDCTANVLNLTSKSYQGEKQIPWLEEEPSCEIAWRTQSQQVPAPPGIIVTRQSEKKTG